MIANIHHLNAVKMRHSCIQITALHVTKMSIWSLQQKNNASPQGIKGSQRICDGGHECIDLTMLQENVLILGCEELW